MVPLPFGIITLALDFNNYYFVELSYIASAYAAVQTWPPGETDMQATIGRVEAGISEILGTVQFIGSDYVYARTPWSIVVTTDTITLSGRTASKGILRTLLSVNDNRIRSRALEAPFRVGFYGASVTAYGSGVPAGQTSYLGPLPTPYNPSDFYAYLSLPYYPATVPDGPPPDAFGAEGDYYRQAVAPRWEEHLYEKLYQKHNGTWTRIGTGFILNTNYLVDISSGYISILQVSWGGVRRPVFPLIDSSLVPKVAVNLVPPTSGTDAFNQDDQGRLHPTLPVTDLGEVCLIGSAPWDEGGFGLFGSF
jgi:hypothetical protein